MGSVLFCAFITITRYKSEIVTTITRKFITYFDLVFRKLTKFEGFTMRCSQRIIEKKKNL